MAAEQRIPEIATLAPHWFGYSRIWKSRLWVKLGQRQEARATLDRALVHYERGMQDLQQWRILLVLDEMKTHGLLSAKESEAFDRYPLKPMLCRNQYTAPWEPGNSLYQFRLSSDEWTEKGQVRLGIPLEWRLAAGLALSGDLGIHTNLIKCWLWPDSLATFFQLEGRLTQLVRRLRNEHGFQILRERESLWLDPAGRNQLGVLPTGDERPSFVNARGSDSFIASDLGRYYSISQSMARVVLAQWLEAGWIKREGAGRSTRYHGSHANPGPSN